MNDSRRKTANNPISETRRKIVQFGALMMSGVSALLGGPSWKKKSVGNIRYRWHVGSTIKQKFYAITVERRLKHPVVMTLFDTARREILA